MTRGGPASACMLAFLCGVLHVLGCAPVVQRPWPENLTVTSGAFLLIESHFVDAADFSKLRYGAILGLARLNTPESFTVKEAGDVLLVGYRLPGEPLSWKAFSPRPDREAAFQDVKFAYEITRQLKPEVSEEILESAMLDSAVIGLDSHSAFVNRANIPGARVNVGGATGAIGVELTIQSGEVVVLNVFDGEPAQLGGIRRGDRIRKIDGVATKGQQLPDIVGMLRGKLGSNVTVTVLRDGWRGERDINLQRARIKITGIMHVPRFLEGGIGLIRIRQFTVDVVRSLESVLQTLERTGLQRLILDLRGNSGGLFPEAQQVAGKFLPAGALISHTKGRLPDQSNERYNDESSPRTSIPLVILVDKNTAAGAELVAVTLQESGRALLVGTQTHGRATVQTVLRLPGDSILRLTTSRWFTPKGNSVDNSGIRPNVLVDTPSIGNPEVWGDLHQDKVLQRALEVIKGQQY